MDGSNIPNRPQYAPNYPSQLREAHSPPSTPASAAVDNQPSNNHSDYGFPQTSTTGEEQPIEHGQNGHSGSNGHQRRRPMTYAQWDQASRCNSEYCKHSSVNSSGLATPMEYPETPYSGRDFPGRYRDVPPPSDQDNAHRILGDAIADGVLGSKTKPGVTGLLAKKNGVKHDRLMYLTYYIPFARWITQYKTTFLVGDLVAALTMASFYIPMSLSLASNLAHVPAINGLYSFAINPLIYAVLGTCPQMIVGPEAAGSLLTGSVVRDSIKRGKTSDHDQLLQAQIAGIVTGTAGAILLCAGVARLGFLDNVLSKPFLRGFISAVGFTILVDQLIPELGLGRIAENNGDAHGTPLEKIIFLGRNISQSHGLTCAVSLGSFAIIMVCREIKRRLQPRYPRVAFVPDRFAIVLIAAILCWRFRWDQKGLSILGDARSATGKPFPAQFPFHFSRLKHVDTALSTAFVVALLGFFESSVAAKSLGTGTSSAIQGLNLSANRELIALGTANVIGGVFSALPAFGGYGRSKVNASTGGKTPMSSIFLSLITFFCIYVLLPYFYYIPKGVLSAMISVVAYSLIEEAPHDLKFFWKIRGWTELFLIFMVFVATVIYSLSLGIALGIGFSILRVIKHATRPRIQILGRVRGTTDQFENAENDPDQSEFIRGCLIVKIPEPLTFANTGELRHRLDRLMSYGTILAHPALPRGHNDVRNKNIIFDIHGVTGLDGAGAQVLYEIMSAYRSQGIRTFFCRVPNPRSPVYKLLDSSGIIEICGGPRHFVRSVGEALRLAELESVSEHYTDADGA